MQVVFVPVLLPQFRCLLTPQPRLSKSTLRFPRLPPSTLLQSRWIDSLPPIVPRPGRDSKVQADNTNLAQVPATSLAEESSQDVEDWNNLFLVEGIKS